MNEARCQAVVAGNPPLITVANIQRLLAALCRHKVALFVAVIDVISEPMTLTFDPTLRLAGGWPPILVDFPRCSVSVMTAAVPHMKLSVRVL